jgi:APA family basic amino acid/polyamine antiporter
MDQTPDHGRTPPRTLLRVVGMAFGIAAVIGGTIGGGILRTPGTVAGMLQDPLLILAVWLGCGALAMASANSMAEMAAALPRAGGPYEYCKVAFGPFTGFVVGWCDWLTNVCAMAFLAVASAEFMTALLHLPVERVPVIALVVLGLMTILNWFGLRLGSRIQEVLSFAKVVGLAAIVVACFVHAARTGHSEIGAQPAGGPGLVPAALLVAVVRSMQLVYETYQGWNSGVYFAEEDRDNGRNLPRAMFIGIFLIIGVYMLVNLAVLMVVPAPQLAQSRLAVADAAGVVFGPAGEHIVTVLALVSLLGILNIIVMYAPRVLFALGRDGLTLRRATAINPWGTPGAATLVCVAVAAALAAAGSFEALFEITALIGMLVNAIVMIALFRLRRTQPDLERPYVAKGYPWLPGIALGTTLTLLVAILFANPLTSAAAIAMLAASYPVFVWLERRASGS